MFLVSLQISHHILNLTQSPQTITSRRIYAFDLFEAKSTNGLPPQIQPLLAKACFYH